MKRPNLYNSTWRGVGPRRGPNPRPPLNCATVFLCLRGEPPLAPRGEAKLRLGTRFRGSSGGDDDAHRPRRWREPPRPTLRRAQPRRHHLRRQPRPPGSRVSPLSLFFLFFFLKNNFILYYADYFTILSDNSSSSFFLVDYSVSSHCCN